MLAHAGLQLENLCTSRSTSQDHVTGALIQQNQIKTWSHGGLLFVFLTLALENIARPWHNKITVKSNPEIFNSCLHWLSLKVSHQEQCHNANLFFSEALTCSTVKSPRLSKLWPAVEFELTCEGQDDSTR